MSDERPEERAASAIVNTGTHNIGNPLAKMQEDIEKIKGNPNYSIPAKWTMVRDQTREMIRNHRHLLTQQGEAIRGQIDEYVNIVKNGYLEILKKLNAAMGRANDKDDIEAAESFMRQISDYRKRLDNEKVDPADSGATLIRERMKKALDKKLFDLLALVDQIMVYQDEFEKHQIKTRHDKRIGKSEH